VAKAAQILAERESKPPEAIVTLVAETTEEANQ
jgi:hypothetical protein